MAYIKFENIIDMKAARKYLTEWHIETLKKAIRRNPDSPHNVDREIELRKLEDKLKSDDEE